MKTVMKKNILYIALLGMISLMTVSCDSELDIEKHGNMGSMDTYYTTDENINTATVSKVALLHMVLYEEPALRRCMVWRRTASGQR